MIDLIDVFLVTAAKDVFATMLEWQVRTEETGTDDYKPSRIKLNEINGSIGFGGKLTGNLFLCMTKGMAEDMTQEILGEGAHSQKEISDVVGELTNMLAGGCKSRICDKGYPVVMSIPNIITGRGIQACAKNIQFMLHHEFRVNDRNDAFQITLLGKFE